MPRGGIWPGLVDPKAPKASRAPLGRQRIDGAHELAAVAHGFARSFFAEDLVAAFSAQRGDLALEVLIDA